MSSSTCHWIVVSNFDIKLYQIPSCIQSSPSQPKISRPLTPSCQPKPAPQSKQPLLDVSTNSITDPSSSNFECLPGAEPVKYALNLMDAFFTDEEMKDHLFIKSQRSRSVRELLPQDKVKKILCEWSSASQFIDTT